MCAKHKHTRGFTIVELLIVIVVIGILAAIAIVAYNGIQERASKASLIADLDNTAKKFELSMVDNSVYPLTMPADTKASPGNVLQATNTGNPTSYCINGYNTNGSLRLSWLSDGGGLKDGLCPGVTIGTAVGGTAPTAPRGVNLAPDFSQWTLTGGASYISSTGILTLGATGSAVSPPVRLDSPTGILTGADFYATTASPYVPAQPDGAMLDGISYYASDGTTAVTNSSNYTANGCAQSFPLGVWKTADTRCVYSGGPNVIYVKVNFVGTNGGYSSPDLQIKNPIILGN